MNPIVTYSLADGIATITMDDGKANAMSVRMLDAINKALDQALIDQAVVVLTGRAGMFSAGFDLSVFKSDPAQLFDMLKAGALLSERILSFPNPIVIASSGHAVAMGSFLLLSADVRLGINEGAKVQANEVQIGLTLPYFAIEMCRQRLSPAHFSLTGITANPYTPVEALSAGFFDELVSAEALMDTARIRATRLQSLNREAFTATKLRLRQISLQLLRSAIEKDLSDWAARFQKS
jgi:enoyl-CoA hydratase